MIDVAVVGSGASAVHAAWPLAEAGRDVVLFDGGATDGVYTQDIPARSFTAIREADPQQWRYFLGEDFSGVPFGPVRVGAQLTPPRAHILRSASDVLRTQAPDFQAAESLALGGLAAGWGAAVPDFSDDDMAGWPLRRADLLPHYRAVSERIGISGAPDDALSRFLGEDIPLQHPARPDSNGRYLLSRYRHHCDAFRRRGLFLGAPRLALLTRRHRGRGPCRYLDMEFWADKDRAVYRPVYTLRELRRFSSFRYEPGVLVESFLPIEGGVRLSLRSLRDGTRSEVEARRVILGAGGIGTPRLVLRSLGLEGQPVPILSNPYAYYPCLLPARIGRASRDRRHSLTQIMGYFQPGGSGDPLQVQFYSYRSLLTFKIAKEAPLGVPAAMRLMTLLQPSFVIVGVHHADRPDAGKRLWLEGDVLRVVYTPTEGETRQQALAESRLRGCLRALGCWPIRRIDPGHGASIHYGGAFPMAVEERPLTTRTDGSLRGADRVHIVDGSVLPHLPAKGLTFTIMANGDRIGREVLRALGG